MSSSIQTQFWAAWEKVASLLLNNPASFGIRNEHPTTGSRISDRFDFAQSKNPKDGLKFSASWEFVSTRPDRIGPENCQRSQPN
jgi:hypothetical protein